MKRTARVARTAHDLDHVSRLRFPHLGLTSLYLKAGSKRSKTYLPPPAVSPTEGEDAFHFVPEKETVEICYEIDDKLGLADGAKIEFFTRFDDAPLWTLDLTTLGPDWFAHGKHSIKWDGRLVKPSSAVAATEESAGYAHDLTAVTADKTLHADFPDGYMSLQHTPYKVRFSLVTKADAEIEKRPAMAWTYFHILIKSFEVVLGDKELIPAVVVDDAQHKRDVAVRKQVEDDGGVPADTATDARKVILLSNIFKTNAAQMDDNTAFTEHETAWGKGPNLPVVAKIRLLASDDTEVKLDESDKGAVALGKAKFLWDWEDPDEAHGQTGKPGAFITAAIDYDKAKTGPKGDNCHVDRGGKRGPSADPVFPVQAGYAAAATLTNGTFPFKVEAAGTRKWSAMSEGWTSGKLKGCTGAVFQPSRMGGDNYILCVYLAYDKSAKDKLALDADTQPLVTPEAVKKKTGKFQVWREVHVARYIRKLSTITDFSTQFGTAANDYTPAYVKLKDVTTANDKYLIAAHKNPLTASAAIDYNEACRDALAAASSWIFSSFVTVDEKADHAAVKAEFKLRSYEDMVKVAHLRLNNRNYTIRSISRASNIVSLETGTGHGLEAGDWVCIGGVADSSFNGVVKVTAEFTDGIQYESAGADGASSGGVIWNNTDIREIADANSWTQAELCSDLGTMSFPAPTSTAKTIAGPPKVFRLENVSTYTTTAAHGFSPGDSVTISGSGDSTFDGTFTVKAAPSTTTFTVDNVGGTAQTGGGTAKTERPVTAAITKVRRLANVATITTAAAHGLTNGTKIVISGVTQAGFNGDQTVASASANSFTFASTAADLAEAAATGAIKKKVELTIAAEQKAGAENIGGTATFRTTANHGFAVNDLIAIAGVTDTSADGTYAVRTVPDAKSFTVSMGGPDRISGNGTARKHTDAEFARLSKTQTWLKDWKFHTVVQYSKSMNFQLPATQLLSRLQLMAGGKTAAAQDGVVIIHFDNVHSIVDEVDGMSPAPSDYGDMIYLLGEAVDVSDATRNRCAFVFYRSDVQTFVHEVGHHLFLPHAKYPTTGNTPGGFVVDRHDDDDDRCIMSYNHPTQKFCGLCQLRLRGWSGLALKKDDDQNKKT